MPDRAEYCFCAELTVPNTNLVCIEEPSAHQAVRLKANTHRAGIPVNRLLFVNECPDVCPAELHCDLVKN